MKACNVQARQLLDAMAYLEDALIEENAPSEECVLSDAEGFVKRRRNFGRLAACAAVLCTAVVSLWVWKSGFITQERSDLNGGQNAGGADLCTPAEHVVQNAPVSDSLETGNGRDMGQNTPNPEDAGISDMVKEETVMEADAEDAVEQSKGAIVRLIEEFPPKQKEQSGITDEANCYKQPEKGNYILHNGLKAAIDYWDNANNTIDLAAPEYYVYHVAIDVFGDVTQNGETVYEELRLSDAGKELLLQEYERLYATGISVSLSEDFQLTGTLSHEEIENFEPFADYGYALRLVGE